MRRIVVVVALVLAALLVTLALAPGTSDSSGEAAGNDGTSPYNTDTLYIGAPEKAMICQTSLIVTNPEGTKRWQANILHPKGGTEMIEESFRRLPQSGIPKDLPSKEWLERYELAGTVCLSWYDMFQLLDLQSLGRASYLLETTGGVVTPFDMRRALMKLLFKDQWEVAERMFPLGEE